MWERNQFIVLTVHSGWKHTFWGTEEVYVQCLGHNAQDSMGKHYVQLHKNSRDAQAVWKDYLTCMWLLTRAGSKLCYTKLSIRFLITKDILGRRQVLLIEEAMAVWSVQMCVILRLPTNRWILMVSKMTRWPTFKFFLPVELLQPNKARLLESSINVATFPKAGLCICPFNLNLFWVQANDKPKVFHLIRNPSPLPRGMSCHLISRMDFHTLPFDQTEGPPTHMFYLCIDWDPSCAKCCINNDDKLYDAISDDPNGNFFDLVDKYGDHCAVNIVVVATSHASLELNTS